MYLCRPRRELLSACAAMGARSVNAVAKMTPSEGNPIALFGGYEPFFIEFGYEPALFDERMYEEATAFFELLPFAIVVDETGKARSNADFIKDSNRPSSDGSLVLIEEKDIAIDEMTF